MHASLCVLMAVAYVIDGAYYQITDPALLLLLKGVRLLQEYRALFNIHYKSTTGYPVSKCGVDN